MVYNLFLIENSIKVARIYMMELLTILQDEDKRNCWKLFYTDQTGNCLTLVIKQKLVETKKIITYIWWLFNRNRIKS